MVCKPCTPATATVAFVLAALAGNAQAQGATAFPAKPVRLIIPFAPGGPTDILGRVVAQKLGEAWGQQVVADNRAGAGGNIGAELTAKAPPDGYTLLVGTQGILTVNPSLYAKLPFDPIKDFEPVTLAATMTSALIVHPSMPVKNVKELIQLAKAKPGQMTYATTGNGSTSHLSMEVLKSMAKVNIVHVPYKGAAPAVTDLLGGHVQMTFISVVAAMPMVRAGKARALGVSSLKRSSAAPEVPTLNESGLPGFDVNNWIAVVAPAGTPRAIVTRLNADFVKAIHDSRERLLSQGFEPTDSTPEQFEAYLKTELAKWSKVVREIGVRAE